MEIWHMLKGKDGLSNKGSFGQPGVATWKKKKLDSVFHTTQNQFNVPQRSKPFSTIRKHEQIRL